MHPSEIHTRAAADFAASRTLDPSLQATTVLNRQPLVCPQQLALSPMEDLALRCVV